VAFQPHRYTRTAHLFDDFARAFNDADEVLLADVYAAGESSIEGADSAHLAEAIRKHGHHAVRYVPDRAEMVKALAGRAEAGDVIISLGAGDINKVLKPIGEALRARGAKG
jgi:UDP-N-acetylmuramate--alanine ligase